MRRQTPVASLLFNYLYPNPQVSDPPNFSIHLARNLIPEIRVETARFYGSLDSIEARYPGLNYCHPPHRLRLSTFPHHARLFRAIDALGLTDHEVLDLVRWEGTIWARERFERDEGYRVKDTTGDGIGPWVKPRSIARTGGIKVDREVEIAVEHVPSTTPAAVQPSVPAIEERDQGNLSDEGEDDDDDMDTDEHISDAIESLGEDVNRRLLAVVAARQQGQQIEMDPRLEEYLKQQIENGSLSSLIMATMQRHSDRQPPRRRREGSGVTRPSTNPTISQPAA